MSYVSSYYRRYSDGSRGYVNGYQSNREEKARGKDTNRCRVCQDCGARIRTRGMRSGKLVTYEAGEGLKWVRHFCAHVGEGLSRTRDATTLDLFNPAVLPPANTFDHVPSSIAPP